MVFCSSFIFLNHNNKLVISVNLIFYYLKQNTDDFFTSLIKQKYTRYFIINSLKLISFEIKFTKASPKRTDKHSNFTVFDI